MENLDYLTTLLLDGEDLEFDFATQKGEFVIEGTLVVKEQGNPFRPRHKKTLNKKALAWMRTHPKYWRVLCGLEEADVKTNIHIFGMLVRAELTELAEMMDRRLQVMMSPLPEEKKGENT